MSHEAASSLYDVAVVGAGVVGAAIARELTKYRLRVALVERAADVCEGTSKANSAIIHTGFDAKPGSLESRLVVEASGEFPELARKLRIPFEPVGAILVAQSEGEAERLPELKRIGEQNGVLDLEILSAEQVRAREPHVAPGVTAGLWVPRESIACGFRTVVAFAANAVANGADLFLESPVTAVTLGDEVRFTSRSVPVKSLTTPRGEIRARWVVNAAGLWSDAVHGFVKKPPFEIRGRKGEFIILDRQSRPLVGGIILPMPTEKTKGILVTPTVYGNVLMGPTADDVDDKEDLSVSTEGLARVARGAHALVPALAREQVVATYAGIRAVGSTGDYYIASDTDLGWTDVAGIRSTGLTSSPAIARYVASGLGDMGFELAPRDDFQEELPHDTLPGWYGRRPFEDRERLLHHPGYAEMLCFCEAISKQEVVDAVHGLVPAKTLDAVKRRTRATTGRCQGFYCLADVTRVLARELDVPLADVTKNGGASTIVKPASVKGGGSRV